MSVYTFLEDFHCLVPRDRGAGHFKWLKLLVTLIFIHHCRPYQSHQLLPRFQLIVRLILLFGSVRASAIDPHVAHCWLLLCSHLEVSLLCGLDPFLRHWSQRFDGSTSPFVPHCLTFHCLAVFARSLPTRSGYLTQGGALRSFDAYNPQGARQQVARFALISCHAQIVFIRSIPLVC